MGVLRRLTGRTMAERYLERGLYHLDKQQYDEAIADLIAAVEQEPYNAELYTTRGFIYLESNKESYLAYAQADFEYALYLDPAEWVAEYCLGMIAYADENYNEALRRFTVARDSAHLHPEPYYYRALCYYQLGEPTRAIKEMEIALDLFKERNDSRKSSARKWRTELKKVEREARKLEKSTPARRAGLPAGNYQPTRPGRQSVTQTGDPGYRRNRFTDE
jgi:tetratricopeptide (TPR) repeat protein